MWLKHLNTVDYMPHLRIKPATSQELDQPVILLKPHVCTVHCGDLEVCTSALLQAFLAWIYPENAFLHWPPYDRLNLWTDILWQMGITIITVWLICLLGSKMSSLLGSSCSESIA